jgi:toxin FitB
MLNLSLFFLLFSDITMLTWINKLEEISMYLSVITFGELRKGIEKFSSSKKKSKLNHRVNDELVNRFKERIIDISIPEFNPWKY